MPELLQDWVGLHAERRPDATAIVLNDERLSYSELERLSNRIARALRQQGCRRGDRICLLMPKTPMAIACILGIYKAGCVYVPLDPDSPAARLAKIVEACGSRRLLAAGPVAPLLNDLLLRGEFESRLSIGWMDHRPRPEKFTVSGLLLDDVLAQPGRPVEPENEAADLAHILFTSGSTGEPKGVMITHANVNHFVEWGLRYFGITPADRLSGHPPLHFDLSVFDIFGAFAAGAELHLVPTGLNVLPNKLADWMRISAITQWFSVPSVLHYLARFDVIRRNDFPALKRLLWCGEVLPTPALIHWMQRLPHVIFTNLYGPTETTIASSYYTVPRCPQSVTAPIPIGRSCDGESLLILDKAMKPVAQGETGDLYIGGAGLSPGYWNDPDKTAEAFARFTNEENASERIYKTGDLARIGPDGYAYFLGRTDSQIKSRGYRIELGEIEAALNTLDCLGECAVLAVPTDGFGDAEVCCAYVASNHRRVTPVSLREELRKLLPSYMLPSHWREFDELPKNPNGKIDRRQLKELMQHDEVITD